MHGPAHISQDSDSERPTKVVSKSRKHSIETHPKDRNCEVCLRYKLTMAPCRRRTGEALPRAEKFGDWKTADHKVLNEEGEPRNNHRYAVVVQDLPTQWNQSYPCKPKYKDFTRDGKEFYESSSSCRKNKLFVLTNHWKIRKSCEDLSWNHRTSTSHRSETNGIAERAVRVKQTLSAVLLQSGLDDKWWSDSMECYCYPRNVQDLLAERKIPFERRLGEPFKEPKIPCGRPPPPSVLALAPPVTCSVP